MLDRNSSHNLPTMVGIGPLSVEVGPSWASSTGVGPWPGSGPICSFCLRTALEESAHSRGCPVSFLERRNLEEARPAGTQQGSDEEPDRHRDHTESEPSCRGSTSPTLCTKRARKLLSAGRAAGQKQGTGSKTAAENMLEVNSGRRRPNQANFDQVLTTGGPNRTMCCQSRPKFGPSLAKFVKDWPKLGRLWSPPPEFTS